MHSTGAPAPRGGPMGGRGRGPMGGGPMAMMKGEKPRDFKGTLNKLIKYLDQYRTLILLVWLFAIASTVASIIGPKILGNATTKLFEGVMAQIAGSGTIDFNFIGHIIVEVLLLYVLSAMLAYIQGWIMANVAMNITYRFRKDISEKINRMPFKYFDGTNHGEVLSRITNDVDTVSQNSQSKPDTDHHFGDHRGWRPGDDANDQLADDPGGDCHAAAVVRDHRCDHQQVAGLLQTATGLSRPY